MLTKKIIATLVVVILLDRKCGGDQESTSMSIIPNIDIDREQAPPDSWAEEVLVVLVGGWESTLIQR